MKQQFISAFTIGIVLVAVAVGAVLFMQRGAHMDLTGTMTVKVHPTDPNTSLASIDLHLTNPASYGFQVSDVTVTLVNKDGKFPVTTVSRVDQQRLAEQMPELGPFHPALYTKYTIPAHSTGDYTLLAQYSAPENIVNARTRFVVRIREVNGTVAELSEK
ncbi:MAG TPA: hypothetical protein VHW09_15670 [Bryobacteraceae bacterium]|jgi:hypothetical protein|nr:hypothetical protein [Bryobacteraceae bacterium]